MTQYCKHCGTRNEVQNADSKSKCKNCGESLFGGPTPTPTPTATPTPTPVPSPRELALIQTQKNLDKIYKLRNY